MARTGQASGEFSKTAKRTEYTGNAYGVKRVKDHGVVMFSLRIEDGIVVEVHESEPDIIAIQSSHVTQNLRRDLGL